MFQIYPNFICIDNVIDNERFDKPLIEEFLDVIDPYTDDYCIAHTGFDVESNNLY